MTQARFTSIENTTPSPCGTCKVRDSSFCGALLNRPRANRPLVPLRLAHGNVCSQRDIYRAHESTAGVYIVCHGWAARVSRLADGRQQILSFLIPGDLVAATALFNETMDFSVRAITKLRFSLFTRSNLKVALTQQPDVFDAWERVFAAQQYETRQLILGLGRQQADARIARLILNLMERLAARGMVTSRSFDFPLSDSDLSDALGLGPLHVTRVLDRLCQNKLIARSDGELTIINPSELQRLALVA